ncbi:sugar transferase [Methylobacterium flocculans]|uniref:sugar transferase n=1 Tax=Methylobacterium flocculans TaxID=2984843 RepID=UPI0021F2CFBB|nr:sugar transferase [Methylobacterium sp. FF17]
MLREAGHPIASVEIASQHLAEVVTRGVLPSKQAQGLGRIGKRSLDIGVAGTALFLLLPLLLLIGLLVWAGDRKAPIFRHMRIGRDGRRFGCLKFRSMVTDGDAVLRAHLAANPAAQREWEETHKLTNDPRVTPLGSVLRKTSLDELPQLVNVMRGEMSLVGPRPIVAAEIERYGAAFPTCFSVTPGVTGLWQVSGRSDCSYAERVALDLDYATRWSFSRDIAIMLRTIPAVLAQRGSR